MTGEPRSSRDVFRSRWHHERGGETQEVEKIVLTTTKGALSMTVLKDARPGPS